MYKQNYKTICMRIIFILVLLGGIFQTSSAQAAAPIVFGWAKKMGGASYDSGASLAVDGSGNVYSIGNFSGTVDFDPGAGISNLTSAGQADTFVNKLDANGNLVWAKRIGGVDDDFGVSIAVDGSGNLYSAGNFSGTADFDPGVGVYNLSSAGSYDMFISKLDANGSFVWAKAFGGASTDRVQGLTMDGSGSIFITGSFQDTADFDPGAGVSNLISARYDDIFMAKYDQGGNLVWAKSIAGTGPYPDNGDELAVDHSGNVYSTGTFSGTADFDPGAGVYNLSSAGNSDAYISKLDTNGNFVWAKRMGGTAADMGADILLDEDGYVFSTGSFNNTADFDPGVGTYNLTSAGYWDSYVSKLDVDGNFVWAKAFGGTLTDNSYGIALDASGSVYTLGGFSNTVDFDPGTGIFNLSSTGSSDVFINKLDTSGNFVWAGHIGGTTLDYGMSLVVDGTGAIYSIGDFAGTADFDPNAGVSNLIGSGYNDVFVSKLSYIPHILYVKQNAGGVNNGASWTDAYTDLQSALNVALGGDEIWVAKGTYKPTATPDRTISFKLKSGVVVYGGFAGSETLRTQRNPVTNVTVLSGDLNGNDNNNVDATEPTRAENSLHVVTSDGAGSSTILDGFTVTGGNANLNTGTDTARGGGLWLGYGSPAIRNVVFTANSALELGGGMLLTNSSSTLTDVTFDKNYSAQGGGGLAVYPGNPIITNTKFTNNMAAATGGGVLNLNGTSSIFTNVIFSGNTSPLRGGGMANYSSYPIISKSIFYDNHTTYPASPGGAGIYNESSSPVVENTTFSNNTSEGGGSGIANDQSNPTITNVTFTDNWDAILNLLDSHPVIRNTIVWGNIYPGTGGVYTIQDYNNSSSTIGDSVIQNGYTGGTNIITTDPLLGALGNYGGFTETIPLRAGSSAMDAGNDAYCPAKDQRGVTRPQGSHCDIGAYEVNGNVHVSMGGILQGSYFIGPSQSNRVSYANINKGPVRIVNTDAAIMAAERVIYKVNGISTSFTEMMGLPDSQLDKVYWLPWYNNVDLDTQLRFGNVSSSTAHVHVYIGVDEMTGSPFTLQPGESTRPSFGGINNGPVKIQSDQNIVAAERVIYKVNGTQTSFSEMMSLPDRQLTTTYWLPWYNNVDLDTQLRFGNVSSNPATVHVYIGTDEMTGSPFTLQPGESTRQSFGGINNGPVKIESDQNIVAAERVIYNVNGTNTSFTETMGLPDSQLTTAYWLPWYNNVDLDTQLRFGNVSGQAAEVHVYAGGIEMQGSPFSLGIGESTRISFAGINNGPVKIESNHGVPIVAAERVIYKVNGVNTSFSEMMALPDSQLNSTYWLPWYNNVDLDTQLRFGVP